jgi:Domain of unknown function (DUF1877)
MSRRGTLYAITPDEADRLIGLAGSDSAVAQEARDLYSFERQKAHLICALDTAWDIIHRCLTDGTHRDFGAGATPLSWCVLGGQSLHGGKETIVCYVARDRVEQIPAALDAIQPQWFYNRFSSIQSSLTGSMGMEDFQNAWEIFTNARNLYSKAVAVGRGVVFVAD